ncbi:MAG: regulatory protein RecX [Acidobacteria bacterium]|nr:regulatory protein RecX [Acidobacteriota bacterium]
MNEIYGHALKLLSARDYTVAKLREKLEAKFGRVPDEVLDRLIRKRFLDDRRFAENYVDKRKNRGAVALREELLARGVEADLAGEILAGSGWPSLPDAVKAKMNDWNLRAPLQSRDAGRLFRALLRLGYDEDAIREEIERLEQ